MKGELKEAITSRLQHLHYPSKREVSDNEFHEALTTYSHTENFEGREQKPGYIALKVYEFMKKQT